MASSENAGNGQDNSKFQAKKSYPPDAPGDFSVDIEVCANFQKCFEGARGGMLGRSEVNGRFRTHIKRQPVTEEEIRIVSQAAVRCPINAILYKGDGTHSFFFEHGVEKPKEPPVEQVELLTNPRDYFTSESDVNYYDEEAATQHGPLNDCA